MILYLTNGSYSSRGMMGRFWWRLGPRYNERTASYIETRHFQLKGNSEWTNLIDIELP